jgi:hypothetical protein
MGQLSGQFGHSDESNCLKLGYDPVQRQWPEWISHLGLAVGTLPQVHPVATPLHRLTPAMAQLTGFPQETIICSGTTDSTAAALATGIQRPGEGVTVLGSTLVVKVLSDRPVFSTRHGVYSHRLGERWLVGGASNSGGAVLLDHFNRQQITDMTAQLQPRRPTGLDYYPLRRPGERFPVNDSQLQPRLTPRPTDDLLFFQGMLEGMAEIEASAYRKLAALGAPAVTHIETLGGGAQNRAWQHIREQATGVPITLARQQEAAYGSALLARAGFFGRNRCNRSHPPAILIPHPGPLPEGEGF